ncbi:ABC transporter ATP-binding protein/permease [Desemzia sp. C1]|uniref:ABC transporter ATP-binding protein n=1 Tax=Desemzia sp. C1 TaxID=2892016 RepID=UPI001E28F9DA|nr:ABC transporter ATP-binding protein [Desemzia sp. C1]MCI3029958.1 ABC transporter ATP-binding protein/permease [Desemzia sp. C1]
MKELFKQLWPFFKSHKKRYGWGIFAMLFSNGAVLIPPYIIGNVIDQIYSNTLTTEKLLLQLGLFFLSIVVTYGTEVFWGYLFFGGRNLLAKELRERLMKHYLRMRAAFYEKYRTGDLMARSTNDLDAISEMAGYGIMVTMDSTVFLGFILTMMFVSVSWKLTLWSMLTMPIMGYLLKVLGDKVNKRYLASQTAFADINDDVLEGVEGVRVVRAYVQEDAMAKRFADKTEDVLQKNIAVAQINALFSPITKILLGISYVIAFGYGAILVSNGELSLGKLISFQVYLGMLVWPVQAVGELINLVQQGSASMKRVAEVLEATDDMDVEGSKTDLEGHDIEYSEVTFKYPSSESANLTSVVAKITRGKTLGIVGKTGSGKTTFIRQLLRQYPVGDGAIKVGSEAIHELKSDVLRPMIGYVPQDYTLFSRSIRENIKFGKADATDEEIMEAVRLANFEEDLDRMPEGLDTLIGERGVAISGGQKQRVSIARALIKNPEFLILDDSLSAVDAKTEQKIIENIQKVRKGKTTIITTHRLSAIHHADWIIVLEDGEIIEEGTHLELISQNGWYGTQYQRQQLKEGSMDEKYS